MKKTILAMCLVGSCTTLFAQVNDSTNRGSNMGTTPTNSTNNSSINNSMSNNGTWNNSTTGNSEMIRNNSTGSYNAYTTTVNVPLHLQSSFTTAYPMASNVSWMQSPEWYRASINNNGRMNHVFYNMNGSSFTLSLPVIASYVPEDVIAKATSMHGNNIYSIGSQRGNNGQDVYVMTLIENGVSRTEWMDAQGTALTDVYRMESTDANAGYNGTNMNNGTMNGTNSNLHNGTMNGTNNRNMNGTNSNLNNGTINGTNSNPNNGTNMNNGTNQNGTGTNQSGTLNGNNNMNGTINGTNSNLNGTNNSNLNGTNNTTNGTNSGTINGTGTTGTGTTGSGTTGSNSGTGSGTTGTGSTMSPTGSGTTGTTGSGTTGTSTNPGSTKKSPGTKTTKKSGQ